MTRIAQPVLQTVGPATSDTGGIARPGFRPLAALTGFGFSCCGSSPCPGYLAEIDAIADPRRGRCQGVSSSDSRHRPGRATAAEAAALRATGAALGSGSVGWFRRGYSSATPASGRPICRKAKGAPERRPSRIEAAASTSGTAWLRRGTGRGSIRPSRAKSAAIGR
jgi:hypothetical protein